MMRARKMFFAVVLVLVFSMIATAVPAFADESPQEVSMSFILAFMDDGTVEVMDDEEAQELLADALSEVSPQNILPNLIRIRTFNVGTSRVEVTFQNIGIDTFDSIVGTVRGFGQNGAPNSLVAVNEFRIRPMETRSVILSAHQRIEGGTVEVWGTEGNVSRPLIMIF